MLLKSILSLVSNNTQTSIYWKKINLSVSQLRLISPEGDKTEVNAAVGRVEGLRALELGVDLESAEGSGALGIN